mmetsp:Transcript_13252/g.36379  ORF Transcript_13252/g.36379 Transcript_13252/m.36379 type:complete len:452 (-) Transcript_13252:35-1390(-)
MATPVMATPVMATPVMAAPVAGAPVRGVAMGGGSGGELDHLQAECYRLRSEVSKLRQRAADAEHRAEEVVAERDEALEHVAELEDFLRPFLTRRERWQRLLRRSTAQVRLDSRLAVNVARELHAAREGRKLEKVNERHGVLEVRHVSVCCEEMLLKWYHNEQQQGLGAWAAGAAGGIISGATGGLISTGSQLKTLDLQSVTRLQYGHETALQTRFPEVSPWLCFTLVTAERSYEFVCPDEHATKCFVLALSRACPSADGAIPTKREFVLKKAWCKINEACARKGKSFAALVVEAGKLTASLKPKSVKVPTISGKRPPTVSVVGDRASQATTFVGNTFAAPSGMLCIESFLASATSVSPPQRRGAWPKAGEIWVFTGVASEVDVYRDAAGLEWANQVKCSDKNGRRAVTIVAAPESTNLVEIRGTDKIKFVKGWMKVVDDSETWLMERADGQ